jgi:predicted nuclease of predicted toxin-antitoxin system
MKFLLDVNIGGSVATILQESDHDVLLVANIDPKMTDSDVLAWSVKDNLILITTDKDFEEMIWRERLPHRGIIRLENLPRIERNALLKETLERYYEDLSDGSIVIATSSKFRVRKKQ